MRYKSFYIKNYKGIKDLTIDLNRDPFTNIITLVGLNESGKTTILEAISVFDNETKPEDIHKLIPKSRNHSFTDTIEIHAILELSIEDEKLIKSFCHSQGFRSVQNIREFTIKEIYEFKNSEYLLDESGKEYEFQLNGLKKKKRYVREYNADTPEFEAINDFICKELLPPIIYYPNFLFDFPKRIYLEASANEEKEQVVYREVLNDILDTLDDDFTIQDHIINRLRNPSDANDEALESTIERISVQISDVVFTAWGELFDSRGKSIKIKPGIDADSGLTYLEIKLKEGLVQFQISERSLGFKWFFTFLLFTEFRKNRMKEKGEILFLLDEPASNLHSTAQKNLLTTFGKLVTKCKMIYTTHSHHLINPKWLSGAYIVKNKAIDYDKEFNTITTNTDVEATIYKQFVVNHPQQRTYFQPILDAIDYSPSNLEEVPNIVLVEGKFDYYTFKYINEVLLNNEYESVNLYPGNSADRNNQIIATYLAWGRDFTILLDGDKAGEDAKKRYIKEFGVIVQGRIITLRDIDAAYNFATESLFTADELLTIVKTFDPTATAFEKSKFNTALQNLFIQEQIIELSEETMAKFRKIFEFIA
jgi:AAA15 family ATPase/GTPase